MSFRSKLAGAKDDIVAGFNHSVDEPPAISALTNVAAGSARVLLFGFLLAYPGVPLLPWGRPAWMVVALGAAVLSLITVKGNWELWPLIGVVWLMTATIRIGPRPSMSIILIGAFLFAASKAVIDYPFLYGIVAGIAVSGVAIQTFDLQLGGVHQMFLSGRAFTPDRAGAEALHLAGFMLLVGLVHFGRTEADRLRARVDRAELARDAAVVEERARIARELHDVVSHHVTAMTLQAEAAAMTGDKTALTSVASAGRDALTELRRMLGVLRRPDDDAPRSALDPQPDLGQLDELARRSSSGPAVRIERRGAVRSLSAGVELCAFRLVQESLTNAAKHSDATTVDVVLTFEPSDLVVDVIDNGRPLVAARVGSGGLGLVGMRERVALLDGELSTGPRLDAQGFAVHARLPTGE